MMDLDVKSKSGAYLEYLDEIFSMLIHGLPNVSYFSESFH